MWVVLPYQIGGKTTIQFMMYSCQFVSLKHNKWVLWRTFKRWYFERWWKTNNLMRKASVNKMAGYQRISHWHWSLSIRLEQQPRSSGSLHNKFPERTFKLDKLKWSQRLYSLDYDVSGPFNPPPPRPSNTSLSLAL